jgi:DNA primase
MIDQLTIDRILDASNIVDVVSDYVTLRRAGTSYKGLCPFHDDKTPSFSVSPARGVCKCFSCGKGGNVVHFLMEMEQIGYVDALKMLAKRYGIEVKEKELTNEERAQQNDRESMFVLNEWASRYFHDILLRDNDGRAIGLAYFRSRGFRDDIIEKFRLGFSLDLQYHPNTLYQEAISKGFKEEFLFKTSLCYKSDDGKVRDKFRGRAMFPWFNVSGKICGFGGRVLDARTKGVSQKYVNSNDSEVFHKLNELYGLFQAKKAIAKEDRAYIVEGYTDVISMHQCGIENVVANSGTALNEAQVRLLHRFTSNVTLLYDGDDAGIHAALRGTDMFLSGGMNVKVLLLPDGDDPDSFARKHNATDFRKYIEEHQVDFIKFKTSVLQKDSENDPIKRATMIKDIVASIALIPEEITRSVYIHECSTMLGIPEQTLINATNLQRKANRDKKLKEQEQEKAREERLANQQKWKDAPTTQTQVVGQSQTTPPGLPPEDMPPFEDFPPHEEELTQTKQTTPPADSNQPAPVVIQTGNNQPVQTPDVGTSTSTQPQSTSVVPTPRMSKEDLRFIQVEKLIMAIIVKYGEQCITTQDDEGNDILMPVVEFVSRELEEDGLRFRDATYQRMLDDARQQLENPNFSAKRFFLSSPDLNISLIAADMLNDQYQLSKMFTEDERIPKEESNIGPMLGHLILDYKITVVDDRLNQLHQMLRDKELLSDSARCSEIMEQYKILKEIQRKIALRLGDRPLANR